MKLQIPQTNGKTEDLEIEAGNVLFVLAPNGSGKSSLLLNWVRMNKEAVIIAGNREVRFVGATVRRSPADALSNIGNAASFMRQDVARHRSGSHNDLSWLDSLLSRLKSKEDHHNAKIAQMAKKQVPLTTEQLQELSPLEHTNSALKAANLGITLSWDDKSSLNVVLGDLSESYGIDQMSDGERAALILIASVVLAERDTCILIDEPERHLHRAISSPLLKNLVGMRKDLNWVIATHDLSLPRDFTSASALILYSYKNVGNGQWTHDLVEANADLPRDVLDAIYGGREKVLFIEGRESSLDHPLYQLLFPSVTLRSRGSCKDVVNSVIAIRDLGTATRIDARGLVDADNRPDKNALKEQSVMALSVYSVESLYFHSSVVKAVAEHAGKSGEVSRILKNACEAIEDTLLRKLADDAAERSLRKLVRQSNPKLSEVDQANPKVTVDVHSIYAYRDDLHQRISQAKNSGDWDSLVRLANIRASNAPKGIASTLGLIPKGYRERALREISKRPSLQDKLRALIGNPFEDLQSPN